tara:strand:- start:1486 stop:3156 length:1671 start_codon:yes stop_codon:yes gene_type:complete
MSLLGTLENPIKDPGYENRPKKKDLKDGEPKISIFYEFPDGTIRYWNGSRLNCRHKKAKNKCNYCKNNSKLTSYSISVKEREKKWEIYVKNHSREEIRLLFLKSKSKKELFKKMGHMGGSYDRESLQSFKDYIETNDIIDFNIWENNIQKNFKFRKYSDRNNLKKKALGEIISKSKRGIHIFNSIVNKINKIKNNKKHIKKLLWDDKDFCNHYVDYDKVNIPILLDCGCSINVSYHYISSSLRNSKMSTGTNLGSYCFECKKKCLSLTKKYNEAKNIIIDIGATISISLEYYIKKCNESKLTPCEIKFDNFIKLPCGHTKKWSVEDLKAFYREYNKKLKNKSGASRCCNNNIGSVEWRKEHLVRLCDKCCLKNDLYPKCMCKQCLKMKLNKEFYDYRSKGGENKGIILNSSVCKICRRKNARESNYNQDWPKFISKTCSDMRNRNKNDHKQKGKKGKYLKNDIKYMTNQLLLCEKRCMNCNCDLNTKKNSPDKASPQRPDASITYTEGNVIWYCVWCNLNQKDYSDKVWQKKEINMVNKLISIGKAKIEDGKVIFS